MADSHEIRALLNPQVTGVLAAQAIITGSAGGAVVTSWAILTGRDWLAYGLGGSAVCFVAAWLFGLSWWRARIEGSQPPAIQAEPAAVQYQLAISWNGSESSGGVYADLPVDFARFTTWCAGVAGGRSLGENHWTGARGLFSKGEYHRLLDELRERGMVRQKTRSHVGGYELTKMGQAVARELARRQAGEAVTHPTGRSAGVRL